MMRNTLRNLLLLVLTLLLFVLTALTWGTGSSNGETQLIRMMHTLKQGNAGYEIRVSDAAAAEPIDVAMTTRNGLVGATYSDLAVSGLWENVKPVLAEALTNAGEMKPTDEKAFKEALTGEVAVCRYSGAIPIHLIAGWLGGTYKGEENGTLIVACRTGELFFRVQDGSIRMGKTTISQSVWQNSEKLLNANGCTFAATGEYGEVLAPETLIFDEDRVRMNTLTVETPILFGDLADGLQTLLAAFEYNPYVQSYGENGGNTRVFVDSDSTLRINNDGNVVFTASVQTKKTEETDLSAQVDAARALLEQAQRAVGDTSRSWLQSVQTEAATGYTVLTFLQSYGGVPVMLNEPLATLKFAGEKPVSVTLHLNRLVPTGQSQYLLPMKQAAAAVSGNNVQIEVAYLPDDDGTLLAERCTTIQK